MQLEVTETDVEGEGRRELVVQSFNFNLFTQVVDEERHIVQSGRQ